MTNDDLIGQTVMVNPVLWDDPANRMGEIGTITQADSNRDDFYVRFSDKQNALYSADALLVLKNPEQLYTYMENHSATLPAETLKDFHSLALLQEHGTPKNLKTAFELAQSNDQLTLNGMVSLEERLGLDQAYKRGR